MPDALVNKQLVEAARKMPQRDQQQGQDGKQGEQPGDSAPQSPAPRPKAPPTDAQAQQDADDAQRRRLEEALRQQQGPPRAGESEAKQAAPETPEQRERRLANEAWLKRVPDDPGALLRARFQLEAQRRLGGRP